MMYGYGYGLGHGLGFSFIGSIFMLIFWVALIWLIVAMVRGGHRCGIHGCGMGVGEEKGKDSAIDILRERYAKGEISKEEFEEKSQTLKGSKGE